MVVGASLAVNSVEASLDENSVDASLAVTCRAVLVFVSVLLAEVLKVVVIEYFEDFARQVQTANSQETLLNLDD